jgi:nucleotide-binding universal stress UspA family protein
MKILIPLDGSDASLDALRHAIRLVREGLAARFVLANVQEPATLYEMVVAHDAQVLKNVSHDAGAHTLSAGEALARAAGLDFDSEVASGDPAHTLVDILERHGCDAVIMGSRGAGGLRGALLGSVSQALLHAVQVPVTIVRAAPAEDVAEEDFA